MLLKRRQVETNQARIIQAFRTRSKSYYADNYGRLSDSPRFERKKVVESILRENVVAGARVLEVGAGPGVMGEVIRQLSAKYTALDLSVDNLMNGRERLRILSGVVGDVQALPIRDHQFDSAVSSGCLEYVENLRLAVHELCRVVRPGGFILASFANVCSPARWWDESIVYPLGRLKGSISRKARIAYRRYLHSFVTVKKLFLECGGHIEAVKYFNPGLIGYPFSDYPVVRRVQSNLARRSIILEKLGSEFLILVRVG